MEGCFRRTTQNNQTQSVHVVHVDMFGESQACSRGIRAAELHLQSFLAHANSDCLGWICSASHGFMFSELHLFRLGT